MAEDKKKLMEAAGKKLAEDALEGVTGGYYMTEEYNPTKTIVEDPIIKSIDKTSPKDGMIL